MSPSSKPCFEFWLLLHHVEEAGLDSLSSARDAERRCAGSWGNITRQISSRRIIHSRLYSTLA